MKAENILNSPFNMQHVSIELNLDIKMLKVEQESENKTEMLFELLVDIKLDFKAMRC